MSHQEEIRSRIVSAAIECIERYGVGGVTIRRIAEVAEVNSAAISYYFGSKDNLIASARELTRREVTRQALVEFDESVAESGDVRAAFRQMLLHLLAGIARYPQITKWHLESWTEAPDENAESEEWNAFFHALHRRITDLLEPAPAEQQRFTVIHIWFSFMLAGLTGRYFFTFSGVDVCTAEGGARWIDSLLDTLIPPRS